MIPDCITKARIKLIGAQMRAESRQTLMLCIAGLSIATAVSIAIMAIESTGVDLSDQIVALLYHWRH